MSKREAKNRYKLRIADDKNNALKEMVRRIKDSAITSDKKLAARFRKSIYWVRKALGGGGSTNRPLSRGRDSRMKFRKIHERAGMLIE